MTRSQFIQFLQRHGVPLATAEQAVGVIDHKVRRRMPLSRDEAGLLELGERFNGKYIVSSTTHTKAGAGHGLLPHEISHVMQQQRGSSPPASRHVYQPNASDLQFLRTRAQRVALGAARFRG